MHLLSQEYHHQGLNASYPGRHGGPPPTFKKHIFPVPSAHSIEIHSHSTSMSHLTEACPISELGEQYKRLGHSTSTVRVDWRFTKHALETLRTKVQSTLGEPQYTLSIQDCLTAYIVSIINRCTTSVPVQRVTNVASVSCVLFIFLRD